MLKEAQCTRHFQIFTFNVSAIRIISTKGGWCTMCWRWNNKWKIIKQTSSFVAGLHCSMQERTQPIPWSCHFMDSWCCQLQWWWVGKCCKPSLPFMIQQPKELIPLNWLLYPHWTLVPSIKIMISGLFPISGFQPTPFLLWEGEFRVPDCVPFLGVTILVMIYHHYPAMILLSQFNCPLHYCCQSS